MKVHLSTSTWESIQTHVARPTLPWRLRCLVGRHKDVYDVVENDGSIRYAICLACRKELPPLEPTEQDPDLAGVHWEASKIREWLRRRHEAN
jgi:hypothetical protein